MLTEFYSWEKVVIQFLDEYYRHEYQLKLTERLIAELKLNNNIEELDAESSVKLLYLNNVQRIALLESIYQKEMALLPLGSDTIKILEYRFKHNYSYEHIAELLQISTPTARNQTISAICNLYDSILTGGEVYERFSSI